MGFVAKRRLGTLGGDTQLTSVIGNILNFSLDEETFHILHFIAQSLCLFFLLPSFPSSGEMDGFNKSNYECKILS